MSNRLYIAGPMTGYESCNWDAFDDAATLLEAAGWNVVNPAEMDRERLRSESTSGFSAADWSMFCVSAEAGVRCDPQYKEMSRIVRSGAINEIEYCDAIAMLSNWHHSLGATAEKAYAEWIGLKVFHSLDEAFEAGPCKIRDLKPEELTQSELDRILDIIDSHVVPPSTPEANESILDEAKRITDGDRQGAYGPARVAFDRHARLFNAYLENKYGDDLPDLKPSDIVHLLMLLKINREAHSHKRDNYVDLAGYARCGARVAGDEM